MAGEQTEMLPDELAEWFDARAAESGLDRSELLFRLVAAYRIVVEEGDRLETVERRQETLLDRVETTSERLSTLEDDVDEKIDDVRSRVVQLKREADQKAPRDHDHPALEERIDAAGSAAADAGDRVDALDRRLDRGFENYEDVLTYLRDVTDDHESKLGTVASVVTDLRDRTAELEVKEARRRAADELKREANRLGVDAADCGECGATVHLGLLARPRCPHCERSFTDVEPGRGFFRSSVLEVGDRPALEGDHDAWGQLFEEDDG